MKDYNKELEIKNELYKCREVHQHRQAMTGLRYAFILAILAMVLSTVLALCGSIMGCGILGSAGVLGLVSLFIKTPILRA